MTLLNIFTKIKRYVFVKKLRLDTQGEGVLHIYGDRLPTLLNRRNIYIGNGIRLNEGVYLYPWGGSKIIISDNVTLSPFVRIFTGGYDLHTILNGMKNKVEQNHVAYDVYIGENCWIGHSSIILPGVKLTGKNVIVGAGSVVTKSFSESNVLIAGNPAVIKKKYKG